MNRPCNIGKENQDHKVIFYKNKLANLVDSLMQIAAAQGCNKVLDYRYFANACRYRCFYIPNSLILEMRIFHQIVQEDD